MATTTQSTSSPRKLILAVSASMYLANEPVSQVIATDWSKPKAREAIVHFETIGYQYDPLNAPEALKGLKETLESKKWDGVIVGWCLRSHAELTTDFGKVVLVVMEHWADKDRGMKIMFSESSEHLVETTLRHFPL